MNDENIGWKTLFFVSLDVGVDVVRCEGIQLYSDHMSILKPKNIGTKGYSTQEVVNISSKIEIEWKDEVGVFKQQTIDRSVDIPATINGSCNLVLYYDKSQWFLRYIETDQIIPHQELKHRVSAWSNISEQPNLHD